MYPFLSCSTMNLHTSSFSSLDNGYTLLFLSTKPSFISMAWSHSFLVCILSLAFLLKTWIHLWNLSDTNFFATSSTSFQISHSSAIFRTSNFLSFLGLFSSLFLSFSSHLLLTSSFHSSSCCFCHPNLYRHFS